MIRRIGGSCSGYERQGFHIDIGTHMFCRGDKGPLGDVLRRAGNPGAIRFVRTRDIAELRFLDPDDATKVRGVAVPADVSRMPRFAFEIARALQLSITDAMRAARLFTYILSMSDAEVVKIINRYWSALFDFIPDALENPREYSIQKTIGTYTWHLVAPAVFEMCRTENNFAKEKMIEVLMKASEYLEEAFWEVGNSDGAGQYSSRAGFAILSEAILGTLPETTVLTI